MRPRHIPSILEVTKRILHGVVESSSCSTATGCGLIAIDGTVGNGHDSLFLASLVGLNGHVYGFDVQESGLRNARERLQAADVAERVTFFHTGHENLADYVPAECFGEIAIGMYNLGYLPGSDKETITRAHTTIASLESLLPLMCEHGVVTVHIYTGHEGGLAEGDSVLQWSKGLDWNEWRVARYDFANKVRNNEILLVIEKLSARKVELC